MMTMRRVLLLGAMAFLGLTACGGDDGGNTGGDTGGNDTATGDDVAGGDDTSGGGGVLEIQPGDKPVCLENDGSMCVEYVGSAYTEDVAGAACDDEDQTFQWGGACPTDGAVGTCSVTAIGESYRMLDYFYSDAANSKIGCEAAGGTWTAL
jgi:hypothetical protein